MLYKKQTLCLLAKEKRKKKHNEETRVRACALQNRVFPAKQIHRRMIDLLLNIFFFYVSLVFFFLQLMQFV